MEIISAVVRYANENGGAVSAIFKVARLSVKLLIEKGGKGLFTEVQNTYRLRSGQVLQTKRKKALEGLALRKYIVILTTPHTMFAAYMLNHALLEEGFQISVITARPPGGYGADVYIVLCPQMFSRLPENMISFQMEQSSSQRWFSRKYLSVLKNSLAILDYSIANIGFLERQGIPYGQMFYMPIKRIPNYLEFLATKGLNVRISGEKVYEVLFYGDVNNERRRKILGQLSERYDLKVISGKFGGELYEHILKAKVVINIHYYENALLETTRICECLSLGVPVVSENSVDKDEYPELLPLVHYVDVGDVAEMIEAIDLVLNAGKIAPSVPAHYGHSESVCVRNSSFYLRRFLLAYGLVEFASISKDGSFPPSFSTGKICLSLPETVSRRESFLSRQMFGFEIFDGLRHEKSWIGCGLSYKYLIVRAKMASLSQVLICEDDAVISKNNEIALSVVEEYLKTLNGEWDIFVGLIAQVHPRVEISKVALFGGVTFVHLDKMTSMVLNIYNHTIYDRLIQWSEHNENPKRNTIDRYLEGMQNLRVITALPFVVGHAEQNVSTLWGGGNEKYSAMIEGSQVLLEDKINAFHKCAKGGNIS